MPVTIELRQIVQRSRDVAVGGAVFLLERFQLALGQRHSLGIFPGPAELVDFGAERGGIALLRQRGHGEAGAGGERERQRQGEAVANRHAA
jgi:hypothetical protein